MPNTSSAGVVSSASPSVSALAVTVWAADWLRCSRAPGAIISAEAAGRLPCTRSTPAETTVGPVYACADVTASVPVPALTRPPSLVSAPVRTADRVKRPSWASVVSMIAGAAPIFTSSKALFKLVPVGWNTPPLKSTRL